ncbi:MAG: hypothetical protein IH987_20105 [Planctomycetes bacterium]|nr:hypothetical protein [Planctomycetota bacterium]
MKHAGLLFGRRTKHAGEFGNLILQRSPRKAKVCDVGAMGGAPQTTNGANANTIAVVLELQVIIFFPFLEKTQTLAELAQHPTKVLEVSRSM